MRMKKFSRLLMCFLCMIMIASVSFGETASFAAAGGSTVYITNTGEKYHDWGCRYLRKSQIAVTLSYAVSHGYSACTVCHAPALSSGWEEERGGWVYYNYDGVATGWQSIGGKWYYFSGSGVMQTGWQTISGKNYYFSDDGDMATGWVQREEDYYYYTSSGDPVDGWKQIGGKWYYFQDYIMQTGWIEIGEHGYMFDDSGKQMTGWIEHNGRRYYFDEAGRPKSGWALLDDAWYYLDDDGMASSGWADIGEDTYYFQEDGTMVTGLLSLEASVFLFDQNGPMLTGWQSLDVDEDGREERFHFSETGAMDTGWFEEFVSESPMFEESVSDDEYALVEDPESEEDYASEGPAGTLCRYYLTERGAVTGWYPVEGDWYYFDDSGVMQTGEIELDLDDDGVAEVFRLDADGKWLTDMASDEIYTLLFPEAVSVSEQAQ